MRTRAGDCVTFDLCFNMIMAMSQLADHYLLFAELKEPTAVDRAVYPFSIPAVRSLGRLEFHPKATFFVGENGTGKSTLLEALAVASGFNAEGGSKHFQFGTRNSHSELHGCLRLARGHVRPRDGYFLRAESFFNVATDIEKLDAEPGNAPPIGSAYGERLLHEQSHGESFLALLTKRFRGAGLYFLDEPEAALSPRRQLSPLVAIHELVKKRSQFIIATHSPILLAYPDAVILQFSEKGIEHINYEATEHYQVTRRFLNDYRRHVNYLFEEDLPGDGQS
jgi:predicted ATPase